MEDQEWDAKTDREKLDWLRSALDRKLTIEMNEIMALSGRLQKIEGELARLALSLAGNGR